MKKSESAMNKKKFETKNKNIFNKINLNFESKKFDPYRCINFYSQFNIWISNSLYYVRNQLKKFLIPFAFCIFSDLLKMGFYIEAKIFILRNKLDFKNFFVNSFEKIERGDFLKELEIKIFYIETSIPIFRILLNFLVQYGTIDCFKFLNERFKIKLNIKKLLFLENSILRDERYKNDKILVEKKKKKVLKKRKKKKKLDKKKTKNSKLYNMFNIKKSLKICKILKLITNHGHNINSMIVSRDENNLITGWQNSMIYVYQKIQEPFQKQKVKLIGHTNAVFATKFSFCNNFVLSGASNGELFLWSLDFKKLLVRYENICAPIWDLEFSKINPFFSSCGGKNSLFLWASDRLFPIRMFLGHNSDVNIVKWHPNYKILASGSSDGTSLIWDIRTGKHVMRIPSSSYPVYSLEFAHDGTKIYMGGLSNTIDIWDIRANRLKKRWQDNIYEKIITNFAYSLNGNHFGYTVNQNIVKVWNNNYLTNSKLKKKTTIDPVFSQTIRTDLEKLFYLNFNENERLLLAGIKNFY
jgi:WD40 repeat protein